MKELRNIYYKYKQKMLPIAMLFAAVFVFFRIIIPQWSDISEALSSIEEKRQIVKAKEDTIQLLNSLPDETVDEDYRLVTTALPVQKDIVLIFSELSSVAQKSNVTLGGFSVKVGDVYVSSSERKQSKAVAGIPFLKILVGVSGPSENLRIFAQELYRALPLVEIKSLDIGQGDARYDVSFYYKPVIERPKNTDKVALEGLTEAERKQIETFRGWTGAN